MALLYPFFIKLFVDHEKMLKPPTLYWARTNVIDLDTTGADIVYVIQFTRDMAGSLKH